MIAINDSNNEYSPGLWSRFDFLVGDGELSYCQISYNSESFTAALGASAADSSDAEAGCNGSPWSVITP